MLLHIRYALRLWKRSRVLASVVVLLLGVGIGASTVIVNLVHSLLLKPLPVNNPQNLFLVEKNRKQQVRPDTDFYYSVFKDLCARTDLLSSVIAEQVWDDNSFFPLESGGGLRYFH
jgi:hypothetical protein